MECDGAAVVGEFPGFGQFGFERVGGAIDAYEDAGRQIADGFGMAIGNLEGIEGFGVAGDGDSEFFCRVAGFRARLAGYGGQRQEGQDALRASFGLPRAA